MTAVSAGCTGDSAEPVTAPTSVGAGDASAGQPDADDTGSNDTDTGPDTGSDQPTVPERTAASDEGADRREAVDATIELMHEEFGYPVDEITVVRVEDVVWESSTFGCAPAEGETVTPGPIDGYRIILGHGDVELHFHGGNDTAPRRCEFADI